MDIVIRQATLKDREAIWDFMRAAYEEDSPGVVQYKVPRRWNWQFADNPFVKDKEEGDLLPIWLACHGQEIAGQMCAMPMRITIGGRTYDGGWGCDFIVLKKYRGLGIGWRLNQAYCEHFQVVVHVTQALAAAGLQGVLGREEIPLDEGAAAENGHTVALDYAFSVEGFPEESSDAENAELEGGDLHVFEQGTRLALENFGADRMHAVDADGVLDGDCGECRQGVTTKTGQRQQVRLNAGTGGRIAGGKYENQRRRRSFSVHQVLQAWYMCQRLGKIERILSETSLRQRSGHERQSNIQNMDVSDLRLHLR